MKHIIYFLTLIFGVGLLQVTAQQIDRNTGVVTATCGDNITLVGQINYLLSNGPFYVVGDKAYISTTNSKSKGYTINIFNISDPSSPALLSSVDFACCFTDIAATDNYVYVAGPQNELIIIDVSDPTNPIEKGSLLILDIRKIVVSGNYAYVAKGVDGVRIVNISDADNPVEVSFCDTPGLAMEVDMLGNNIYVADGNTGLRVIDVSDPTNPTEIGFYDTPGLALGVYTSGNYAYVGDWQKGLRIIDVSDPVNPFEAGFLDIGNNVVGVARLGGFGNYVYIPMANVINMVDVSVPSLPEIVGSYATASGSNGMIADIHGIGQYIYACDKYAGFYILQNDLISAYDEHTIPTSLDFAIYPNPTRNEFGVRSLASKAFGFGVEDCTIELFDLNGKKLLEKHIPAETETVEINVSSLKSGVYFCKVSTDEFSVTKKLIIQK